MNAFLLRRACIAVCALAWCTAQASGLLADFHTAQNNDATFAASLAEYQTAQMQAATAGMSYYPQASLSRTQLPNEGTDRQTFSLSQPVLHADRWLALQEKEPRAAMAEHQHTQSRQDLARRLFQAVRALCAAREQRVLNTKTLEAVQAQMQAAQRTYELGRGTVTDVLDAQVLLAQARSQEHTLRAALEAATRQYQSIVGAPPAANAYPLHDRAIALTLPPLDTLLAQADAHPTLRTRVLAVTLGDISRKRAKAAYLPSLNAVFQHSTSSGTSTTNSGLVLRWEVPVDMSGYLRIQSAGIEVQRLRELERGARTQVQLDVQRLYAEVQSSLAEIAIRREAIHAAQQSLYANEQSFAGGVRTRIAVLHAVQALQRTRTEYLTALLTLGEKWLDLQLQCATDLDAALEGVQALLFGAT
ncbi:TolC family protein [Candidatus Symbiobacter mobilis]|uniref:Outer membrane protein n=1 Tax=Candidatus Symbiobacter mobilis CR TaxID=946483 RepID=U5NAR9_9BURK|nr:TolC family protein [Candidatus Symbiobacter mobilis]AGX88502.1 outer membrane protein [Candidatus Symbiobacter mobilis CR]